jgi:hypothetical protein
MSHLVNGRTAAEIQSDPRWATTQSDAASRNNWPNLNLLAELGLLNGSTGTFTPLSGTGVPNAVRVTATDVVSFYFASVVGINNGSVSRTAVATNAASACMEVGSFALALSQNPSSLLGALLNGALGATVVSYSGLANAQIQLKDLAAQLGFGTPSQLFNAIVKEKQFIVAEANALQAAGDTANATLLNSIATSVSSTTTINMGDLITVQQGSEQAALNTAFNALDLLAGAGFLANGTNAIGLTTGVLGVTSASVKVIEKPQTGCGNIGGPVPTVQTSQLTFTFDQDVTVAGIGVVQVHVVQDTASASATFVAPLSCGPPAKANVNVSSSLVTMSIRQTALGIPTTVTPAPQSAGNNVLSFTIPPDSYNVMKRSGTGSVGLSGTTITGLGLDPSVVAALNTTFGQLDTKIVQPISQMIGLEVAGADAMIKPSVTCAAVKLAL